MNKKLDVKLAFKLTDRANGSLVGKVIGWWTNSLAYHVEIIVGDNWISSNAEHGGVTINPLRTLKETWMYHDLGKIEVTEKQYSDFLDFIDSQKGKKYDWLGIILSQTIPFNWHSKNKWFCSEITTKLLQLLLVRETFDLDPNDVSPADLARLFNIHVPFRKGKLW